MVMMNVQEHLLMDLVQSINNHLEHALHQPDRDTSDFHLQKAVSDFQEFQRELFLSRRPSGVGK